MQDTRPLAEIPEPSDSLRAQTEDSCKKLEKLMSTNNMDLLEALVSIYISHT